MSSSVVDVIRKGVKPEGIQHPGGTTRTKGTTRTPNRRWGWIAKDRWIITPTTRRRKEAGPRESEKRKTLPPCPPFVEQATTFLARCGQARNYLPDYRPGRDSLFIWWGSALPGPCLLALRSASPSGTLIECLLGLLPGFWTWPAKEVACLTTLPDLL